MSNTHKLTILVFVLVFQTGLQGTQQAFDRLTISGKHFSIEENPFEFYLKRYRPTLTTRPLHTAEQDGISADWMIENGKLYLRKIKVSVWFEKHPVQIRNKILTLNDFTKESKFLADWFDGDITLITGRYSLENKQNGGIPKVKYRIRLEKGVITDKWIIKTQRVDKLPFES